MLIISHRLSSLTDCDAILAVDQGRVMDIGQHQELLQRCCRYETSFIAVDFECLKKPIRPARTFLAYGWEAPTVSDVARHH